MKKISILVVDDNTDFQDLMDIYIKKTDDLEMIGAASDGIEAIEKIIELQPDVMILDLIMPNLDGLGVLEKIKTTKFDKKPMIIVLSALGQDMLVRKAMSYGIEYYLVKPLEIGQLMMRIRQMFQDKDKPLEFIEENRSVNSQQGTRKLSINYGRQDDSLTDIIEADVTNLLYESGVSPHMIGYRYLKEAIIYTLNKDKCFTSITRELYPAVAEKFFVTPQKVERAIRNCIEKAWLKNSHDTMDSLLGYSKNNSKNKPTNSEFIALMAEKIRFTQKCL